MHGFKTGMVGMFNLCVISLLENEREREANVTGKVKGTSHSNRVASCLRNQRGEKASVQTNYQGNN